MIDQQGVDALFALCRRQRNRIAVLEEQNHRLHQRNTELEEELADAEAQRLPALVRKQAG